MDFGDFPTVPKWVLVHPQGVRIVLDLLFEKAPHSGDSPYTIYTWRNEFELGIPEETVEPEDPSKVRKSILMLSLFCEGKQGVCHNVALPFTLKSMLRQM
jgi:hypothetical protein